MGRLADKPLLLGGRIWLALLLLALAALAWRPIVYTSSVIAGYPYSLDREEAFVMEQALAMRAGESIYQPVAELPFKVGNYPPVYPALAALASLAFEEPLSAGRFVAFLGLLGALGILGSCVLVLGRSWLPAALAPLLFLLTYDTGRWMAYARVDFPALFLSGAGLLLALWRPFRHWEYAAAAAFVFAFYTKPTQVAALGGVLLALAICREWRPLLRLAASSGAATLLVGLVLIAATAGEFWRHVVVYNRNEMHWGGVLNYVRHMWRLMGWWLLGGGAALFVTAWVTVREGLPFRLVLTLVYTLFGALTILMAAKVGSAENYLLEFEWALALVTGVALSLALAKLSRRVPGWKAIVGGAGVLGLLSAHALFLWQPLPRAILFPPPPGQAERQAADQLLLHVMGTSGPVLSEDAAFLIATGRPVYFEPFIMSQLTREGQWDDAPVVAMLEDGYFQLLVAVQRLDPDGRTPGWTDAMKRAVAERYEFMGEAFLGAPQGRPESRFLYRPRSQ